MMRALAAVAVTTMAAMAWTTRKQPTAPVAIVGVTVIPMDRERLLEDQTLLIANGRIAAVGPRAAVTIPRNARRIDGRGKFAMPGLWDMHVHPDDPEIYPISPPNVQKELLLPLFVLQGVTGIRDMGGDLTLLTGWRRRIASGELVGPRIVTGGPLVDGPRPMWPGSVPVADSAAAVRAIDSLRAGGADFIKVYSLLPRAAYFALAREARRRGIPFAGHVPEAVGVAESSDSGQRSQEHLLNVMRDVGDAPGARRLTDSLGLRGGIRRYVVVNEHLLATYDSVRAASLYRRLARNGTWQTPTLINWETNAFGEPDSLTRERLPFLPAYLRHWWDPRVNVHSQEQDSSLVAIRRKLVPQYGVIVRQMHAAGVRLLAGTDQGGNPFCYPGWSLHDELRLFVRAGLTPFQALETATRNPADFLGVADSLGTIATGRLADVVLLDANPLVDIGNVARINAIVVRGRVIDAVERRRMLNDVRQRAQATRFP